MSTLSLKVLMYFFTFFVRDRLLVYFSADYSFSFPLPSQKGGPEFRPHENPDQYLTVAWHNSVQLNVFHISGSSFVMSSLLSKKIRCKLLFTSLPASLLPGVIKSHLGITFKCHILMADILHVVHFYKLAGNKFWLRNYKANYYFF